MIKNIHLLHYLSENTYKKICNKLELRETNPKTGIGDNFIEFHNQKIYKVHLFNIVYKELGHIWFMRSHIDFQKFGCSYDDFEKELYISYYELFGADIMSDFPPYAYLNCDYIEYACTIRVESADKEIARLKGSGCVPEQLDRMLWHTYKKAHGTVEFCLCKEDDTHMQTLARCHGTALKKRIQDTAHHRATGVMPGVTVKAGTEEEIMSWLYDKYKIIKLG